MRRSRRSWLGRSAPKVAHTLERGRLKFNQSFDRLVHWYVGSVTRVVDRKWLFLGIYAGVVVILALLFVRLPTGFLPTEDQGAALVQFRLPAGATTTRTVQVQRAVENYFLNGPETKNVKTYFTVAGGGQGAAGQNTGQAFINLADYDQRPGKQNSADAIVARASAAFRRLRDAQVFALVPGAIRGLGQSTGFTMEIQNTGGISEQDFAAARDKLLALATADPKLTSVRLSELPDVASLKMNIDQQRLAALGLSAGDVNNTIAAAWGGRYVNDFVDRGRVKRVYVQGDADYRSEPSDMGQWYRPQ